MSMNTADPLSLRQMYPDPVIGGHGCGSPGQLGSLHATVAASRVQWDARLEEPKGARDHHAKVAGDASLGMVAAKRPPTLGGNVRPSTGLR